MKVGMCQGNFLAKEMSKIANLFTISDKFLVIVITDFFFLGGKFEYFSAMNF
jgi:hypothetical protein